MLQITVELTQSEHFLLVRVIQQNAVTWHFWNQELKNGSFLSIHKPRCLPLISFSDHHEVCSSTMTGRPSGVQREEVKGPHVCRVLVNNLELPSFGCISFISRAVGGGIVSPGESFPGRSRDLLPPELTERE